MIQVVGTYMIIGYLDPQGLVCEFPKLGVLFWGAPRIKTIVYWGRMYLNLTLGDSQLWRPCAPMTFLITPGQ